jgi:cytochrome b6-f complex iron-sulfur subunit
MTAISSKRPPLNGRELTYYLLFAALALFGAAITAASLWYLSSPKPGPIELGPITDFPPADHPYPVRLDETSVWVVHTGEGITVFDKRTPYAYTAGRPCIVAWVEANGRFEDPCSGSKFTLDGRLIDPPAERNLDQYPVIIKNDHLFIDPTQLIPGETAAPLCWLTNDCTYQGGQPP